MPRIRIQPEMKANVVTIPRQLSLFGGRAYGYEITNELNSLANYLAIVRAINPTRRILVRYDISTSNILQTNMGGKVDTDRAMTKILNLLKAFTPSTAVANLATIQVYEEALILFRAKQGDKVAAELPAETKLLLDVISFFRFSDEMLEEFPIGAILDATSGKSLYETGFFGFVTSAISIPTDNTNGASILSLLGLSFEAGTGNTTTVTQDFVSSMIQADVLHILPKLRALIQTQEFAIIDPDPLVRYNAMQKLAKLIRFVSLQPFFMYCRQLSDLLKHPEMESAIKTMTSSFYEAEIYKQFENRLTSITHGHVYQHIINDCTSGTATTRFGEHPIIRVPSLLSDTFSTEGGGKLDYTIPLISLASSSSGAPNAAKSIHRKMTDMTDIMRAFVSISSNDDIWNEFKSFGQSVGYGMPNDTNDHNYMNPPFMISDGWTSTDPVNYKAAVSSMVIHPLELRNGGPCKIALVQQPKASDDMINMETNVAEIRRLSPGTVSLKSLTDKGILGTKEKPFHDVFWVVKKTAFHIMADDELRTMLNGRLPMHFYSGDSDAVLLQHTTFEDFANDLGLSPKSLAMILKGSDIYVSNVADKLKELLGLFFSDAKPVSGSSIFERPASRYGLPETSFNSFRHESYFVSARSTVLQVGAMVRLLPLKTEPIKLFSKELGASAARTAVSFRVIVAEPAMPYETSEAFNSGVTFGDDMATAWGAVMPVIPTI